MAGYRRRETTAEQMAEEIGITPRRVRQLYRDYLKACASGEDEKWEPGKSGGYHGKEIPEEIKELWIKMLSAVPPASYSFIASEGLRRHGFITDRATVRRWAIQKGYAHKEKKVDQVASVRRWQCAEVGTLWQLDASSHRWFAENEESFAMLNMLDDCSRVITGARLYPRECLLAYLDFLSRAFETYGLPLALYVDYHSFFFSQIPDNLTYLGEALRFYDVSLKYAPTPQAKGKIERHHQFWQKRLPSYFAAEGIDRIDMANQHLELLRLHHNEKEIHRELQMSPQQAWTRARREKRYVLRPCCKNPWWHYIWSVRNRVRVGIDGRVPVDYLRLGISARIASWVLRCTHPDGSYTFLANEPGTGGKPIVLLRYEGSGSKWKV